MSAQNDRLVTLRIPAEKADRLGDLAKATARSDSWHLEQALDAYLDQQAQELAQIEEGLADSLEGRTVPHDRVREWLLSWGQVDEREPPA